VALGLLLIFVLFVAKRQIHRFLTIRSMAAMIPLSRRGTYAL